jgi:flagellar hook-basal body complex protein FliE
MGCGDLVHYRDVISDMNTAENSMETAVDFKEKKCLLGLA